MVHMIRRGLLIHFVGGFVGGYGAESTFDGLGDVFASCASYAIHLDGRRPVRSDCDFDDLHGWFPYRFVQTSRTLPFWSCFSEIAHPWFRMVLAATATP